MAKVSKISDKQEKTIELKYEIFRPGASMFMSLWHEVTAYKKYPVQLLMKIAKITRQLDVEHDVWTDTWKKIIDQYAKKDDKGAILPQLKDGKPRPNTFEIADEHVEAWKKALDELDATTFKVKANKLTINGLIGAGMLLSPQEILILGELLDENEDS